MVVAFQWNAQVKFEESNLVQPRVFGEMPLIDGLLRPAGEGVYPSESDSSLSWDEVNNPGKRNDLITKCWFPLVK